MNNKSKKITVKKQKQNQETINRIEQGKDAVIKILKRIKDKRK